MMTQAGEGGLAGFVATMPMTAAMLIMHRFLPKHEQQPLPPRKITLRAARRADVARHLDHQERTSATMAAHFGFGSTAGSLYGVACSQGVRPGAATGILYGLLVWAGSYLGFLPAAGLHESATDDAPNRTLLMIVAHVVWGAALGSLMSILQSNEEAQR